MAFPTAATFAGLGVSESSSFIFRPNSKVQESSRLKRTWQLSCQLSDYCVSTSVYQDPLTGLVHKLCCHSRFILRGGVTSNTSLQCAFGNRLRYPIPGLRLLCG